MSGRRSGVEGEGVRRFVAGGGYAKSVAAVRAVCGAGVDADDAVQEALAAAIGRADIRELGPWVTVVAINYVRQHQRRDARRAVILARIAPPEDEREPTFHDDVIAALRRLPDRQREVVVLHYLWDLPVAEVAALLSVSQSTVKVQLLRARSRLRSDLDPIEREVRA